MKSSLPRDLIWVLALCVAASGIGTWKARFVKGGRTDPVSATIQRIEDPASTAFTLSANAFSDFAAGIIYARSLRSQVRVLRSEADSIRLYQQQVELYKTELDDVRKEIGMPAEGGKRRVPADVIDFNPPNSLVLDIGADEDVKVHEPIVCAEGLVGRVETVGSHRCTCMLLSSPDLTIGASVLRNPPEPGLLHGESQNNLVLELTNPQAPVDVGDVVVTSGFSDMIPRGIPIGTVHQVYTDVEFGALRVSVFPYVAVGSLREVFVLQ